MFRGAAPASQLACPSESLPGFFPVSLGRGVLTNPQFPPFAVLPGPRNSWTDRISKVVEHTHRRSPLASCPSYRLLRRHANPTSEAQAPSPEESRKELAGKFSANAAGRRVASPQPGADRQGPALGQVAGPPLLVFCCVVLCFVFNKNYLSQVMVSTCLVRSLSNSRTYSSEPHGSPLSACRGLTWPPLKVLLWLYQILNDSPLTLFFHVQKLLLD